MNIIKKVMHIFGLLADARKWRKACVQITKYMFPTLPCTATDKNNGISHICVFTTSSTSCHLYDTLTIHVMNISIYECMYVRIKSEADWKQNSWFVSVPNHKLMQRLCGDSSIPPQFVNYKPYCSGLLPGWQSQIYRNRVCI